MRDEARHTADDAIGMIRERRDDVLTRLSDKVVGVVYGPSSVEDRTYSEALPRSEWSATRIVSALHAVGVAARVVDPTAAHFVDELGACDVVFVNSHGHFGEDGRLQGILEHLGLPYSFSGVLAQAVGLDKLVTKAVFEHLEVLTPRSTPARSVDAAVTDNPFGFPVMVKVPDGGSSLGLELVHHRNGLEAARAAIAAQGYDTIFLEEHVPGRSVTVSVLETGGVLRALPPIEVEADAPFYDAACKLGAGAGAQSFVPDDLPVDLVDRMQRDAVRVGEFLHARGAYRVDFVVTSSGGAYALEINAVPGMQLTSNLPEAARRAGLEYVDLVLSLLSSALDAPVSRTGSRTP